MMPASTTTAPVKVLVFQNRFLIGGQERQTVLHLATLDRSRWEPVVRCLHLEGEHLEDLARIGVRPESLDIDRMARPSTLWRAARLAAQLRAEGVALVHAQDFYTDTLGFLVASLARVPSIVTRVDLGHALDPTQRKVLALVSRMAARVVVNALCIRDACLCEGVEAARVAVVRNGVDLEAFDAACAREPHAPFLSLDPARPVVVKVANMHHPVKGQGDVLFAHREVLRQVPEAQLVLVGDGARRPALQKLAGDLGIAHCVRFVGYRRDVPSILARASVLASASYAEGISNAVLEGMAARRPVVGTAVGGTPELVRDGITGFLVPPRSPAMIAERTVALLRDPALARRMGEEGRAVVEREFAVEAMRRRYDQLYEEVLLERGRRLRRAA